MKNKLKMNSLINYCLFVAILFQCVEVKSQNEFYNNGANITVQNNGLIFVQGEFINSDNGANIGLTNNSGTIALSGNWTNNSTSSALTPSLGTVELNGAFQQINGSQTTTFNNLTLLGTNTKQLAIYTIVGGNTGTLNLTARPLDLNSNTLTVTNPMPNSVIRTTGYIISETPATPGYGTVQWNLGTNTGNYIFPFGTVSGIYIPVSHTIATAGVQSGIGNISISTYPTLTSAALNNRPLPTGVSNLINNCGTEHATRMLDRYWVIDANNYSSNPIVTKNLTYTDDGWDLTAGSTNTIIEPLLNTWYYNGANWATTNSSNNSTLNQQSISSNTLSGIFTLGEYKNLQLNLVKIDSVKCFGENNGVIQFSTTPSYGNNAYDWNSVVSTDTIKTNLVAGSYTIIATDAMGCKDTINAVFVNEPFLLTQTLTSNDYSICRNEVINITNTLNGGTKPYTLSWSTGSVVNNSFASVNSITNTPIANTTYSAFVNDKNNCLVNASLAINVNQLPVVNFDAPTKKGCQPLFVGFTNQSGNTPKIISYVWSFAQGVNSTQQSPNIVFNNTGTYTVSLQATSDSGCVNTTIKNNFITVYEKPYANFEYSSINSTPDILNPSYDFQNTSTGNFTNTFWNFGDGHTSTQSPIISHDFLDAGFYNVKLIVYTVNSCIDSLTKQVEIKDAPAIYIPNTFTPQNGDGLNDNFTIKGVEVSDFKMLIFDRWGQKIAESNDATIGWDGKFKGQDCMQGTYIYQISFRYINGLQKGKTNTITGHVNLLP